MPKDLPAEAKKIWREMVPLLAKTYGLTRFDKDILAMYCVRTADFRKNWGANWSGQKLGQYRHLLVELGMTPQARMRGAHPSSLAAALSTSPESCQQNGKLRLTLVNDLSTRRSNMPSTLSRKKSPPADT